MFNLTLHGVGEPCRPLKAGEEEVWLSLAALEKLLDEVCTRRDLRITVDDGNSSDAQVLLWELGRRELTATFFVVAGRLDQDGSLSTHDVEAILRDGHSLGSHGMRHRPLRGLDRQALEEELSRARDVLGSIRGKAITELSCPFGSYDRRVLSRARDLGYEHVYTSDGGPAHPRAWLQPRTTISGLGQRSVGDITEPSRRGVLVGRAKRTVKRWR